jgi:hypothetical protein
MIGSPLAFLIGLFIGTGLGVIFMCLLQANKERNYEE